MKGLEIQKLQRQADKETDKKKKIKLLRKIKQLKFDVEVLK